jgi:hypothetical protein
MQKLSFVHKIWYYQEIVWLFYSILTSKIRLRRQAPSSTVAIHPDPKKRLTGGERANNVPESAALAGYSLMRD